MKRTILFAGLILSCLMSKAQTFSNYLSDGIYRFDDHMKISKDGVFANYADQFGFSQGNTMVLQSEYKFDNKGGQSDRYIQYCNGHKVENGMLNVISKYGIVLYVTGFSLPKLNVDPTPTILEADALNAALLNIGAEKYAWDDPNLESAIKMHVSYPSDSGRPDTTYDFSKTYYPVGELVISTPWGDTSIYDSSKYRLCWKFAVNPLSLDTFRVDTNTVDTIPHYQTVIDYRLHNEVLIYVDANSGSVYRYDPNVYSLYIGTLSTLNEGNQSVQVNYNGIFWWASGLHKYNWNDNSRDILLNHGSSTSYLQPEWNDGDPTWGWETGRDAYNQMQKISDYFRDYHNIYGTTITSHYEKYQNIWKDQSSTGEYRYSYSYNSTNDFDGYYLASNSSGGGIATSPAFMDITGHEYMHAIQFHGPHYWNTNQPAAIAEGLCDIFGAWGASHEYTTGGYYFSDWSNGFGWHNGEYVRRFDNPGSDQLHGASRAASGYYGDSYFWAAGGDKYVESGVMRKYFNLMWNGGFYRGQTINPSTNLETDLYNTMYGWTWSSVSFQGFANACLAEYEYVYGKCSPNWTSSLSAWLSLNVHPTASFCRRSYILDPHVILIDQVGTPTAHFAVRPTGDNNNANVLSYVWIKPQEWTVAYSNNNSEMQLVSTSNSLTQTVQCIVNYNDLTSDTLTTVLHIVDSFGQKPAIQQVAGNTEEISIYPNPAKTKLNVMLPKAPLNTVSLSITDLTGKQVYASQLNSQTSTINISTLTNGVYIVKIKGDGYDFVKRLLIQ